jgi:predicted dehydrogenase
MRQINVGLVGCGTIALAMHLPGLATMREMGKVNLLAVCDAIDEKAQAAGDKFGVEDRYRQLDDLLGRDDIELVVNTTPIPEHFAVTLAALRAGKHVYTQKPMAGTIEEATALIDEAKLRGLILGCAPEHAVRPVIQTLRTLVTQGVIGRINFCKVQSSHDGPEKHNVPRDSTWYYQPGSSPILDLGVHGLSQITSVLGPVRRLACFSGRSLPFRMTTAGPFVGKRIDVNIDDNTLLMLDFGNSTFGYLDSTYCVEASLAPRIEIYGSEGSIALLGPGEQQPLRLYRSETRAWEPVETPDTPPVRDLGVLHLVDCLLEGQDLVLTGEHARHLVDVMTKAPEAARAKSTMEMETTF